MKKILRKKTLKEKEVESKGEKVSIKNPKFDILSEINDMKILEENCLLNGNYEDAINYAEKVIRLTLKNNMDSFLQEQEEFMRRVAERVQEVYFSSEIGESGKMIKKIYDILLNSDKIYEVHEILESFKSHYRNNPSFYTIPLIKELIKKDETEWLKYQILHQDEN
ncbi:MAG: hypothetical protein ACXACC_07865 [Promethearchaeota archaeon]|jgi:hypothetical protein